MTQSPSARKQEQRKQGLQNFAKKHVLPRLHPIASWVPALGSTHPSQPKSRLYLGNHFGEPSPPAWSLSISYLCVAEHVPTRQGSDIKSHSSFPLWPDPINTLILERCHKYCSLILWHGIKGLYRKLLSMVCKERGHSVASSPSRGSHPSQAGTGERSV